MAEPYVDPTEDDPITTETPVFTDTVQPISDPVDIRPESTVSSQMSGLLSQDNPYMQSAETQGLKKMNKRGLLNSTLAIEAGEAARIDAALPIAQQDAKTYSDADLSRQRYQEDASKSAMNAELSANLASHEGKLKSELQSQVDEARYNHEVMAQAANTERLLIERQAMAEIAAMELSQADIKSLHDTIMNFGTQYERDYAEILLSKDFATAGAKRDALAGISDAYQANVELAASLIGVEIDWTAGVPAPDPITTEPWVQDPTPNAIIDPDQPPPTTTAPPPTTTAPPPTTTAPTPTTTTRIPITTSLTPAPTTTEEPPPTYPTPLLPGVYKTPIGVDDTYDEYPMTPY